MNNYYVQELCTPTRSALLSGVYPIHTGLQSRTIHAVSPYGLPLKYKLLPQQLKYYSNYSTHLIGKWHIGYFNWKFTPTYRGFDTFLGYYLAKQDYWTHFEQQYKVKGIDWRYNENILDVNFPSSNYSAFIYGNETIKLLRKYQQEQEEPWFIYLSFQSVHYPLQAPESYINFYQNKISNSGRRALAGQVTVLDDVIGEIVHVLKENSSLWDNTMVILSSDNGGHNDWTKHGHSNFPFRGGKATLWEGGVRGVGIVNGGYLPNNRRGQICNQLMHVTDWFPTLANIGGQFIPYGNKKQQGYMDLDGYDMTNVILYDFVNSSRNTLLHNINPYDCDFNKYTICGAIRYKEWKLVIGNQVSDDYDLWQNFGDNTNIPTVDCKINSSEIPLSYNSNENQCPRNGEACLYNIIDDPCEYKDVKNDYPVIYEYMYKLLLSYNNTMVEPLIATSWDDTKYCDPEQSKFNGYWTPWINDSMLIERNINKMNYLDDEGNGYQLIPMIYDTDTDAMTTTSTTSATYTNNTDNNDIKSSMDINTNSNIDTIINVNDSMDIKATTNNINSKIDINTQGNSSGSINSVLVLIGTICSTLCVVCLFACNRFDKRPKIRYSQLVDKGYENTNQQIEMNDN